jgi:hypothetical protein
MKAASRASYVAENSREYDEAVIHPQQTTA